MTHLPLVYIIILNWNGRQDTIECVESCRGLSYPNFRILIVDNGSTDGSESILRERFPSVEFIQTGENLGFAGGNNTGIRYAIEQGADYIWLLNNDTVVDSEALGELLKVAESDEKIGIVGSKIYYYDKPDILWFAGGMWRRNKSFTSHRGQDEIDTGQYDETCEVDYITGCSLLIKSSVIKEVGMMNEDYFLYWEEVDWNAVVSEEGWKILYVPGSLVWHKISASIRDQTYLQMYYYIRNGLLFFQKHEPKRLFRLFPYVIYVALKFYKNGRKDIAEGYLRGITDFALRRFGKIQTPHRSRKL